MSEKETLKIILMEDIPFEPNTKKEKKTNDSHKLRQEMTKSNNNCRVFLLICTVIILFLGSLLGLVLFRIHKDPKFKDVLKERFSFFKKISQRKGKKTVNEPTEPPENRATKQSETNMKYKWENKNALKGEKMNEKHQEKVYGRKLPVLKADVEKQEKIVDAFLHAWNGYKKHAWGHDFLKPLSKRGENVFSGGLTITDSLDTLIIMGLDQELKDAREWVKNNFKMEGSYSVFETVIRHVGGFISAYELTNDEIYLEKAKYVADTLLPVFNSKTGLFKTYFIVNNGMITPKGNAEALLSDLGSVQLEFYKLSALTGDNKYALAVSKIHKKLFKDFKSGLLPERIDTATGNGYNNIYSIDAMSDSYYEYLIKIYLLGDMKLPEYLDHYLLAVESIKKELLFDEKDFTFIGKRDNNIKVSSMTHLVTFAAGMLALGSITENEAAQKDLQLADKLASTYIKLYNSFSSGLMPECLRISGGKPTNCDDSYRLRPETIESLFVLYRLTGLPKYREQAWQIFLSIEKHCKVNTGGYASVSHLDSHKTEKKDLQDSYFLSETLKYLYLIFSDSTLLPTDEYIYNTEAHPFKILTEEQASKLHSLINL